ASNIVVSDKIVCTAAMFKSCDNLVEIDSEWDMSNVTNVEDMFRWDRKLETLNLASWITSKIENWYCAFDDCQKLKIDNSVIENFDMSNAENTYNMFYRCYGISGHLDLTKWNLKNIESMSKTFRRCKNITSIDASNWQFDNATTVSEIFSGCS